MTDQTESDDIPICEDECVTWGGHAANCRVPAAIRALEAKVRELEDDGAAMSANQCLHNAIIGDDGGNSYCTVKADRDRLAGEVERMKADGERYYAKAVELHTALRAENAKLREELDHRREHMRREIPLGRSTGGEG